jgi:HD-GYP domain-containing protein (c-di-GMP phosphodiesterase class II)
MRRRVLYDGSSRAAAAAAHLLADEYDVGEVSDLVADAVPTVVLLEPDSRHVRQAGRHVRAVALVDPTAQGPWSAEWYALVPVGAARPLVARAVENAFADLEADAEVARLDRELSELNAIGIRLSAERNPRELLETILTKARETTNSDAGSLYLVDEAADGTRHLRFALAQNDSIEIPFRTTTLPLTNDSVAGHVALAGRILNLEDAYAPPPGAPYHINRAFDERTGYRTKSMLVVPMRTPQGETIGVLQLINCKLDFAVRLETREEIERLVKPFGARHEKLAGSLASQAAVAVANSRLYEAVRQLFEGFVQASVTAIESRDPTTSGHSFRVANLTVGLASVVDHVTRGPYASLRFTSDEMKELRYAALLHDFGKVGVREQVLVKAKKLHPAELDRIRQRAEQIKRSLELRYAGKKIEYLLAKGKRRYPEHAQALDAELRASLTDVDASLARIVLANEPAILPRDVVEDIERLARRTFEDDRGGRQTLITPEEASILAIPKGSLTPDEVRQIQSHVVHTYQFLAQIPWTKEFRRIPEIARSHHEKLDGSGYPYGMNADEIPVQSKMMTIADIYDALTASDRPYKNAVPAETALDILNEERRAGHIDPALLDLFIESRVYMRTGVNVIPQEAERRRPIR